MGELCKTSVTLSTTNCGKDSRRFLGVGSRRVARAEPADGSKFNLNHRCPRAGGVDAAWAQCIARSGDEASRRAVLAMNCHCALQVGDTPAPELRCILQRDRAAAVYGD